MPDRDAIQRVTESMLATSEPERLALLPHPKGALRSEGRVGSHSVMNAPINWTEWIAPEWLASLGRAASLPYEAAQGQPVTQDQANEFGLSLMGGGSAFGRAPHGSLGMFAGVRSKKADMAQLLTAQEMREKGVSAEKVFAQTGWWQDLDKHWKYEIDDSASTMNQLPLQWRRESTGEEVYGVPLFEGFSFSNVPKTLKPGEVANRTLSDTIAHPPVYEAYPDIAQIPVKSTGFNFGVAGSYTPNPDRIMLGNGTKGEVRQTALHEQQHAIQEREGWAKGGNAGQFLPEKFLEEQKAVQQQLDNFEREFKSTNPDFSRWAVKEGFALRKTPPPPQQRLMGFQEKGKRALEEVEASPSGQAYVELYEREKAMAREQDEAFKKYIALSGEVLARTVEKRRDYTPEQRRATFPMKDFDVDAANIHGY